MRQNVAARVYLMAAFESGFRANCFAKKVYLLILSQ